MIETHRKTMNHPSKFVTVEVKLSDRWKRDFEGPSRALRAFAKESHQKMVGVYTGNEILTFDGFEVFPVQEFIKRLYSGRLLGNDS